MTYVQPGQTVLSYRNLNSLVAIVNKEQMTLKNTVWLCLFGHLWLLSALQNCDPILPVSASPFPPKPASLLSPLFIQPTIPSFAVIKYDEQRSTYMRIVLGVLFAFVAVFGTSQDSSILYGRMAKTESQRKA